MRAQHFDRVTLGGGPALLGEGRGLYTVDVGTPRRVAVLAASSPGVDLEEPAFDLIEAERFDIVATLEASVEGAAVAHSYARSPSPRSCDSVMEASAAIYSLMAQGGWDESRAMVFSVTHASARFAEHRARAWLVVRAASASEIEVEHHSGWDAVTEELEARRGSPQKEESAVLLFNVDGMLAFNDRDGHSAGDLLLARIHSCIANEAFSCFTQRVGGDEFAVLCPAPGALALAESLRASVESMKIPHEHPMVKTGGHVTVSVGVLDSVPSSLQSDPRALKSHLQEIVYKSKSAGRNRVTRQEG